MWRLLRELNSGLALKALPAEDVLCELCAALLRAGSYRLAGRCNSACCMQKGPVCSPTHSSQSSIETKLTGLQRWAMHCFRACSRAMSSPAQDACCRAASHAAWLLRAQLMPCRYLTGAASTPLPLEQAEQVCSLQFSSASLHRVSAANSQLGQVQRRRPAHSDAARVHPMSLSSCLSIECTWPVSQHTGLTAVATNCR